MGKRKKRKKVTKGIEAPQRCTLRYGEKCFVFNVVINREAIEVKIKRKRTRKRKRKEQRNKTKQTQEKKKEKKGK